MVTRLLAGQVKPADRQQTGRDGCVGVSMKQARSTQNPRRPRAEEEGRREKIQSVRGGLGWYSTVQDAWGRWEECPVWTDGITGRQAST
jgi:hypothetical protein